MNYVRSISEPIAPIGRSFSDATSTKLIPPFIDITFFKGRTHRPAIGWDLLIANFIPGFSSETRWMSVWSAVDRSKPPYATPRSNPGWKESFTHKLSSLIQGYTSHSCGALFFTTLSSPLNRKTTGDIGKRARQLGIPIFFIDLKQKCRFANVSPVENIIWMQFSRQLDKPSERR